MNERIRVLAEEATIKTSHKYHTWGDRIATKTTEVFDREKFAELIVRECAEWMDAEQDEQGDGISDNFYWSARMKKHFGVEE